MANVVDIDRAAERLDEAWTAADLAVEVISKSNTPKEMDHPNVIHVNIDEAPLRRAGRGRRTSVAPNDSRRVLSALSPPCGFRGIAEAMLGIQRETRARERRLGFVALQALVSDSKTSGDS